MAGATRMRSGGFRGFIDLLLGGPGMRRGRRDPEHVRVGDALDFWRVEEIEADRLLRLRAEMKVPGRAWLQFEIRAEGDECVVYQTAIFDPLGLFGLLYWYGIYPVITCPYFQGYAEPHCARLWPRGLSTHSMCCREDRQVCDAGLGVGGIGASRICRCDYKRRCVKKWGPRANVDASLHKGNEPLPALAKDHWKKRTEYKDDG